MMQRETGYDPVGEIDFGTAHDEDTKGNADDYQTAKLTAKDGKLRLLITTKHTTIYKMDVSTDSKREFEIDPDQLIELIESNGKRV